MPSYLAVHHPTLMSIRSSYLPYLVATAASSAPTNNENKQQAEAAEDSSKAAVYALPLQYAPAAIIV